MLKTQIVQQTQSPGKASLLNDGKNHEDRSDYVKGISKRGAELNKKTLGKLTYADLGGSFHIKGTQNAKSLDCLFEQIRSNMH